MRDTRADVPTALPPEAGIYTETLARLYLRQGFLERAVSIYRHLVQEQPENQHLQAQLNALEQQLQHGDMESEALEVPSAPQVEVPAPPRRKVHPEHTVLAQLERWLRYLQQQRGSP